MAQKTFECPHKAKLALLAIGAVALIGAHPGPHEAPQKAALEAVAKPSAGTPVETVETFHRALKRGDTPAALALLDEQVVIFESGEVERDRAEYAAHHLQADATFSAATNRSLQQRTQGQSGDTAWVASIETVTGTYRERPINSQSLETMILKKDQRGWRIVQIHWSSKRLETK